MAMKIRLLLVLTFMAAVASPLRAQQHRTALFVGNSYTAVNNLPQMVADVAASMGDELSFRSNTPGGCTFQQHCTNQSMQLINQGAWDVVVLQEQSQLPSFPQNQVEQEVFPFARRLVDSAYAANPCVEPMFYMTWGRKNGDAGNAPSFPVLGTYEGMDSMLCLRYTYMADVNDASLCPVGRVWRTLRQQHPQIELYQSDESHPSVAGTYAAACAFYVMLFHRDPMLITFDGGLAEEVAETIRSVVYEVVYNHLSQWQRPKPMADFTFDSVSTTVIRFTSRATHAAYTHWSFGDGDTLTTTDMVLTHNYPDSGSYQVMQTAWRHCMSDTAIQSVLIRRATPVAAPTIDDATLSLFPNPANDGVEVSFPSGFLSDGTVNVDLIAADGRRISTTTATTNRIRIDLSGLTTQWGIIRVVTSSECYSKKIVKQ